MSKTEVFVSTFFFFNYSHYAEILVCVSGLDMCLKLLRGKQEIIQFL